MLSISDARASSSSSSRLFDTRMRVFRLQTCPEFLSEPIRSASTPAGISASSRNTAADLPPNSSVIGRRRAPQRSARCRPAAVDPVNETLSTPGCNAKYSLSSRPAGSTFNTPGGNPASTAISANR